MPLYQEVKEMILNDIHEKQLKEGDLLPSENQLIESLKVSSITVKRAFEELVRDGLIYRVQGKGTFFAGDTTGELAWPDTVADSTHQESGRRSRGARRGVETYSGKTGLNRTTMPCVAYLTPRLHNEYMIELLKQIEAELETLNHYLLFSRTHENQETEKKHLEQIASFGVKGIIIYPVDGETYNEEILRLTLNACPLVVIDRYFRGIQTNCVCSDNIQGAFQATEHLLQLGHRNIAFISHQIEGTSSIEDRFTGYQNALAAYNVSVRSEYILSSLKFDNEKNKDAITQFLTQTPDITAILAVNTTIGRELVDAATAIGRKVPDDLSIVFFDKIERLPIKPTFVQQSPERIAREAVSLLFKAIEDPTRKRIKIDLPTTLVIGDSTVSRETISATR
jgi:GntR family transcriptional regulator of arabinose operon